MIDLHICTHNARGMQSDVVLIVFQENDKCCMINVQQVSSVTDTTTSGHLLCPDTNYIVIDCSFRSVVSW